MLLELFWIIFGALIGWIGCILQGETAPRRIMLLILTGITGGVLGGFSGNLVGAESVNTDAGVTSFIFAVFGALVLVLLAGRTDSSRSE